MTFAVFIKVKKVAYLELRSCALIYIYKKITRDRTKTADLFKNVFPALGVWWKSVWSIERELVKVNVCLSVNKEFLLITGYLLVTYSQLVHLAIFENINLGRAGWASDLFASRSQFWSSEELVNWINICTQLCVHQIYNLLMAEKQYQ